MPQNQTGRPATFDCDKQQLIDTAFARRRPETIADLGGVWNVDGAYCFYSSETYDLKSAFLVDSDFSDRVLARCRDGQRVTPLTGMIGAPEVAEQIGAVDAVFLFDVLLHQVAPNWDEVLELYAPRTSTFVIYNPQWTGDETLRLLDLGREDYFANIPHAEAEAGYDTLFDRLDEQYPAHDRLVRDVHYIWQWGITDQSLRQTMQKLGFVEVVERSYGQFGSAPQFERRGFVFERVD